MNISSLFYSGKVNQIRSHRKDVVLLRIMRNFGRERVLAYL